MMIVLVMFADLVEAIDFLPQDGGGSTNAPEASRKAAGAGKISLEIGIGDGMEEFRTVNRTSGNTEDPRQAAPRHDWMKREKPGK
jgi:hypothetical protein